MIRKNKHLVLLLCLSTIGCNLYSQWVIERTITTSNLNSIQLYNENSGWAVGENGTILCLNQNIWSNYGKITSAHLYSLVLIDDNMGWAVGSKGTILSLNGKQWKEVDSPTNENLYSVCFSDPDHGLAVGAKGTIIEFENGVWQVTKNEIKGNLFRVVNTSEAYLIGGGLEYASIPIMEMNKDSDKDLISLFDPGYVVIKDLAFQDNTNLWAVGMSGAILHFNGKNWYKHLLCNKVPSLNSICFADGNTGIAVGFNGTILLYNNEGWKTEVSPVNIRLNGAAVVGSKFYAVGNKGTIIYYTRTFEDQKLHGRIDSLLIGIGTYPNPANDHLNIIIPYEDCFEAGTLYITNNSGQILLTEKLNGLTAGQRYQVNTSNLVTGLYLVEIRTSGKKAVGRFIVKR